jgi:molybdate transport system ATP-binding protein
MSLLEFKCRLCYSSGFELDAAFTMDHPVTAICGPSGSGKTSILSIIAGLRRPDQGTVRLGKSVLDDRVNGIHVAPEKRRIGYVFQDQLLFPHLSVRRNLLYGWKRRPRGTESVDFHRVGEVLELKELIDRYPHTLSGGQRQRVALGRALLSAPELLLLDEPLVSLDAPLKDRVLDYVEQVLKEWRIPTLYVTHDMRDVKRLAQQVIILEKGQVVREEKADGAFNSR